VTSLLFLLFDEAAVFADVTELFECRRQTETVIRCATQHELCNAQLFWHTVETSHNPRYLAEASYIVYKYTQRLVRDWALHDEE